MTREQIDAIFERAREWPLDRQEEAAEMLLILEDRAKGIYHLSDEESAKLGIKGLPHNLEDALTALEADSVLKTALGDHIYEAFISEKRREWADYREQVHDWEFKQYLDRY